MVPMRQQAVPTYIAGMNDAYRALTMLTNLRFVSLQTPYLYAEENDFPLWGNFTYSTSPSQGQNFSFESGYSGDLRYNYVMQRGLNNIVDGNYRPYGTSEPVFAYAHDFGSVSEATVMYTVGSVQQPLIRYLTSAGVLPLNPWWMQCYGDIFQMINFHYSDFPQNQQLAAAYEEQLKVDVDSYYSANVYSNSTPSPPYPYSNGSQGYTTGTDQFGDQYEFDPNNAYGFLDPNNFSGIAIPEVSEAESYYSIIALSTRQVMGAYALTVPPPVNSSDSSQPLMFQKEISSDGNVNTVDVMYPAMPFFLYSNVELLRYNLEPLYQNQEGGFYPNAYSMHDLGTNFPNATGHVEGDDEYMPVEESGNMIIMSYAYYAFSSNSAWLSQRYAQLQKWASYLIEFSLIPGNQLSTDDFAGRLINQTNLAIKGIVGLQAMSKIAAVVGDSAGESNYSATASQYFSQWETLAIDPSGKHTVLGYEWRSSWGLLYNIYPDRLLSLGIIPDQLYNMQSSWYATVSQVFGIPLDNRHHHTKSDWEIWTAATCDASTRRLFVNGLAYWLNGTSSGVPFPDLYETISQGEQPVSPDMVDFQARPVRWSLFFPLAFQLLFLALFSLCPSHSMSWCFLPSKAHRGLLRRVEWSIWRLSSVILSDQKHGDISVGLFGSSLVYY